jgi:hypothetical protein
MAFFCAAVSDSGASTIWTPSDVTPWYSGGSGRSGDLDYWDARMKLGQGVAIPYTSDNNLKLAAIGFIINKV